MPFVKMAFSLIFQYVFCIFCTQLVRIALYSSAFKVSPKVLSFHFLILQNMISISFIFIHKPKAQLHLNGNLFPSFNYIQQQLCPSYPTGLVAEMYCGDPSSDSLQELVISKTCDPRAAAVQNIFHPCSRILDTLGNLLFTAGVKGLYGSCGYGICSS